ncbi:hypothetical protein BJX68DRAFT_268520 [Aspergillus pseudodeflectus]|uniref:Zn(2)-C6 fungal-type domain-containing protein n=1 Tax=Aspergillus pseudodeflectus TaxID=176178 RepID=A0ABR4K412_9EURO
MPPTLLPTTTSTLPTRANPSPTNTTAADKERDKPAPSKPRPITSCAACRLRKVKCDRLTPCTACTTRKPPTECTYSTTSEEREAIAAADLIAELRATRNRLQGQLANSKSGSSMSAGPGAVLPGFRGAGGLPTGYDRGEGEDAAALEAVYAVLREGSWDVAREVVGKIRGGEGVRGVLGEIDEGGSTTTQL